MAAPDRFAPKSDDFASQAVLTSRAGGTAGVHLLPLLLLTPCNVPAYALETGLPENLRAPRREGCPGTLLAKLSVVQDGRQADVCPVAWQMCG